MVSSSPVTLSVLRGVCLRPVVMSLLLSLVGLSWYGGKYASANAHTLPTQSSYSYRLGRNPLRGTQYLPQASILSPTVPDDYDLRSFLLSKLHQSYMTLHKKRLLGSKSEIHKRQTNDKELIEKILSILQRLQNQREANPALTMPSLRFR